MPSSLDNTDTTQWTPVSRASPAFGKKIYYHRVMYVLQILVTVWFNMYLIWSARPSSAEVYFWIWICIGIFLSVMESINGIVKLVPIRRATELTFDAMVASSNESLDYPTIDIFVTCYLEPTLVIEETLMALKDIIYPSDKLNIYLCDDGGRDSIALLLSVVNCAPDHRQSGNFHYLRRDRSAGLAETNPKAHNINNALRHSSGQFVAIFDADMCAKETFLTVMMPHFYLQSNVQDGRQQYKLDDSLSCVYGSQQFKNIHPLEDPFGHASTLFFKVILPGLDALGIPLSTGSNFIMTRAAVEKIGGIPATTLTEDFHMSIQLLSLGYRAYYCSETLASGLAPMTSKGVSRQRKRWCKGSVQIAYRHFPYFSGKIPWYKRALLFVFINYYALFSLASVYVLVVFLIALYGIYPIQALNRCFGMHFAIYEAVSRIASFSVPTRSSNVTVSNYLLLGATIFGVYLMAICSVISRPRQQIFKASPKSPSLKHTSIMSSVSSFASPQSLSPQPSLSVLSQSRLSPPPVSRRLSLPVIPSTSTFSAQSPLFVPSPPLFVPSPPLFVPSPPLFVPGASSGDLEANEGTIHASDGRHTDLDQQPYRRKRARARRGKPSCYQQRSSFFTVALVCLVIITINLIVSIILLPNRPSVDLFSYFTIVAFLLIPITNMIYIGFLVEFSPPPDFQPPCTLKPRAWRFRTALTMNALFLLTAIGLMLATPNTPGLPFTCYP